MLNIHFFQMFSGFFIIVVVFWLATVGVGFWYRYEAQKIKRLKQYGLRSQAQVINLRKLTSYTRNGSRRVGYDVTCRFYYEGQYFDYKRDVGSGTFERLRQGAWIPVLFLPGQPATMQIEDDTTFKNSIVAGFIPCLIISLIMAFFVFMAFVNYY